MQQQVVINGKALTIVRAKKSDLDEIHSLMELVYRDMPDKSLFVCDNKAFVKECLEDNGFAIVVKSEFGKIIASLLLRYPGNAPDNLGYDLGLSEEEAQSVVHMESAVVLQEYRGFGLQRKMVEFGESLVDNTRYKYFMATVSPDNIYSLNTFLDAGYNVMITKEKYDGLIRSILLKKK